MSDLIGACETLQTDPPVAWWVLIAWSVIGAIKHLRLGDAIIGFLRPVHAVVWGIVLRRSGATKAEVRRLLKDRADRSDL